MVYLRNVRLRWSVAAEEKYAEPLISHSIDSNRDLISSCFSSSRRGRESDWGFWRLGFLGIE